MQLIADPMVGVVTFAVVLVLVNPSKTVRERIRLKAQMVGII